MLLLCSSVLVALLALGTATPMPGSGGVGAADVPAGGFAPGLPIRSCTKFCKNDFTGYYDCCDHIRPGKCPPIRLTCPSVKTFAPNECFIDSECSDPIEKCCFDVCLEHKTCKRPDL